MSKEREAAIQKIVNKSCDNEGVVEYYAGLGFDAGYAAGAASRDHEVGVLIRVLKTIKNMDVYLTNQPDTRAALMRDFYKSKLERAIEYAKAALRSNKEKSDAHS